MAGDSWLIGVYRGKLVTAGGEYSKVWKDLGRSRSSPFLEFADSREYLKAHFFFLEPLQEGHFRVLKKFDAAAYGLPQMGYWALRWAKGSGNKGGVSIPAKGSLSGDSFVVDGVGDDVLEALDGSGGICALCFVNAKPRKYYYGRVRTGTFFAYKVDGKRLSFKPLLRRMRSPLGGSVRSCLVGKGILVGAYPWEEDATPGGMDDMQYGKEHFCPVTVGESSFTTNAGRHFIVFREAGTDLRLDMPAALLLLRKERGFERMARQLGRSVDHAFGKFIDNVAQRNVLADGNIVDYADINQNPRFPFCDVKKDAGKLEGLVLDVFRLLFLCSAVSACGEQAFGAFEDMKKFSGFSSANAAKIRKTYGILRARFMDGLGGEKKAFFRGLEDFDARFASVLREGWKDKHTEWAW